MVRSHPAARLTRRRDGSIAAAYTPPRVEPDDGRFSHSKRFVDAHRRREHAAQETVIRIVREQGRRDATNVVLALGGMGNPDQWAEDEDELCAA